MGKKTFSVLYITVNKIFLKIISKHIASNKNKGENKQKKRNSKEKKRSTRNTAWQNCLTDTQKVFQQTNMKDHRKHRWHLNSTIWLMDTTK